MYMQTKKKTHEYLSENRAKQSETEEIPKRLSTHNKV